MRVTIALGAIALALVIVVLELVRRRRLKERFAVVWIAFSVIAALGVLLPAAVEAVARQLGFELPANLVLVAGMAAVVIVAIQLSVEAGRLRDAVERLASRIAILEAERGLSGRRSGPAYHNCV